MFSNEYLNEHIDKIIIQGHTDSQTFQGEYSEDEQYMKNMELSLKRAYTVANFITNTPYNKINGNRLRKMIICEGASYSEPIITKGKEDYAKSRRVELKIVMKETSKYKELLNMNDSENKPLVSNTAKVETKPVNKKRTKKEKLNDFIKSVKSFRLPTYSPKKS